MQINIQSEHIQSELQIFDIAHSEFLPIHSCVTTVYLCIDYITQ